MLPMRESLQILRYKQTENEEVEKYCSCCRVIQSCPTLCDLMHCREDCFPVHHQLLELAQTHDHQLVMPSKHFSLCHPLLPLPSIFPSIRVFSSESVLCIRWPKDWSFSFSISPSNKYSGLISFRMDWLYIDIFKKCVASQNNQN